MSSAVPNFSREVFMAAFRDDACLQQLTVDDRVEIFRQILTGSSDFPQELLEQVLEDYNAAHLRVVGVVDVQKI